MTIEIMSITSILLLFNNDLLYILAYTFPSPFGENSNVPIKCAIPLSSWIEVGGWTAKAMNSEAQADGNDWAGGCGLTNFIGVRRLDY